MISPNMVVDGLTWRERTDPGTTIEQQTYTDFGHI